jgi:hypothetical protein
MRNISGRPPYYRFPLQSDVGLRYVNTGAIEDHYLEVREFKFVAMDGTIAVYREIPRPTTQRDTNRWRSRALAAEETVAEMRKLVC